MCTSNIDFAVFLFVYMHAPHTHTHSHSVADVIDFLKAFKMDSCINAFQEHQIDGDILLAIVARKDDKLKDTSVKEMSVKETSVADLILQELGVKSAVHRLRIKTKFEGFCNKSLSTQSSTKLK